MRKVSFWIFIFFTSAYCSNNRSDKIDWLIDGSSFKSTIIEKDGFVTISNGLISRTFSLTPDGATTGFANLMTGKELIRAVKPEAILTINRKPFSVGGLVGQPVNNFLKKEWLTSLKPDSLSPFRLFGYKTGKISARFEWKKRPDWMARDMPWPPDGKQIDFTYLAKKDAGDITGIKIVVHYEIYDGLPLLCKWLTVCNESGKEILISSFTSEILALAEEESSVGDKKNWILPNLYVETDYAFGGSMSSESCYEKSVWWVSDPEYKTIVNYTRLQPSMLECRPMIGPYERVNPGKSFDSFRTWILVNDSSERERNGLAQRKMYRTISPWVTENPIFMHLRYSDNESIKKAVDQCVNTGFEKIILSFGSGFNIEDTSKANLDRYKELVDYAHSKGIALGGYRLYDAPETLEVVKKWVSFYKGHRAILDADIIHVKRADGRGIDAILHVDPSNNEKGLLMVYNPLDTAVKLNLTINIYYSGLSRVALISENGENYKRFPINRNYDITIPVAIEPHSQSWYIIR